MVKKIKEFFRIIILAIIGLIIATLASFILVWMGEETSVTVYGNTVFASRLMAFSICILVAVILESIKGASAFCVFIDMAADILACLYVHEAFLQASDVYKSMIVPSLVTIAFATFVSSKLAEGKVGLFAKWGKKE